MEPSQAAEHLQAIRTLMERSALYRRALAPIMTYCGTVGVLGGVAGNYLPLTATKGAVLFWAGIGLTALIGAMLLVRRQALKDSEPFWSPPTRRVMQALIPPFTVGAFCAALAVAFGPEDWTLLIPCWCIFFGLGIFSAGFFTPRGLKIFGWLFIGVGCSLFLLLMLDMSLPLFRAPHLLMGGVFGGLHLAYGIYLYFTEKRGNES